MVSRVLGTLLLCGAIGLGVVHLRSEQARTARRIQNIQVEMVGIRRQLWSVQLAIAQNKSPRRIGKEVEERALNVAAPRPPEPARVHDVKCADAE